MSFKDIDIKPCYESGTDDIVDDFYVPVLNNSVTYDRIAGFFSSSALAIAGRGLYGFIKNGGKMRLITSPILNAADGRMIEKIASQEDDVDLKDFGIDFDNLEDEFVIHHVKALGWMLQQGYLEMKLAVVTNDKGESMTVEESVKTGLFHQKVGILKDSEGLELSFSGSINESASAWIYNDEEFKVFKAWTDSNEYFKRDKSRFDELWNGERQNVQVYNLPHAIRSKLIQYSADFDIEQISVKQYHKKRNLMFDFKDSKIPLFYYQANALNMWRDNNYQLLFEMATGTGKTRTAIAGIVRICQLFKKVFIVISTPQNTLSKQWKKEIESFDLGIQNIEIIDGTIRSWQGELSKLLLSNSNGMADQVIVLTTHNSASSDKFLSTIQKYASPDTQMVFVGDEVHWLGAANLRKALLPLYKYRIGLSATPTRWFDENGTALLRGYFGNKSFEFTLRDALTEINPITKKHFLVHYYYHISTVSLNDDETANYKKITQQIIKIQSQIDKDNDARVKYERLLGKRANIIKNAEAKYIELKNILDKLQKNNSLQNLIIFVSPEQIKTVMTILLEKGIVFHKLTEQEGTKKENKYNGLSEREYIIRAFKEGKYKAIIAIKCMDEGIDIPSADTGILMSSSTNPREYVQRIGRIIRQDEGKQFANLYDICVDKIYNLDGEELELEKTIRKKEAIRLEEIARNALNPTEALEIITNLKY